MKIFQPFGFIHTFHLITKKENFIIQMRKKYLRFTKKTKFKFFDQKKILLKVTLDF